MKRIPWHRVAAALPLLAVGGLVGLAQPVGPSAVKEVRIQKVGDFTYFHVRLDLPRDMLLDSNRFDRGLLFVASPSLAPRLVAPDGQVRLVCQRFDRDPRNRVFDGGRPPDVVQPEPIPGPRDKERPREKGGADQRPIRRLDRPIPVEGLEFVGRTDARGEVKLKLLYPVEGKRLPGIGQLSRTPPPATWKEMEVTLDFSKARQVPIPEEAKERREQAGKAALAADGPRGQFLRFFPVGDDLEGLWASAQVDQFLDLDTESVEFGFHGFAATAAARKYGVPLRPFGGASSASATAACQATTSTATCTTRRPEQQPLRSRSNCGA